MLRIKVIFSSICVIVLFFLLFPCISFAQIERFQPSESKAIEVWRVTNDPIVRDHVNYTNTQCWSPDGRYICFSHYAPDDKEFGAMTTAEVHLYDFYNDKDIKVDNGAEPRWANNHNWLFYTRTRPQDGLPYEKGTQVMWLDVDSQKLTRIAYGVQTLRELDCGDRWIYGMQTLTDEIIVGWQFGTQTNADAKTLGVRIPIQSDSRPEILNCKGGWDSKCLMVNPVHPVIVNRDLKNYPDTYDSQSGFRLPFVARPRYDSDLEGNNGTERLPYMEAGHFTWSGNGTYYLLGNNQLRGRRWDEPLPSNIHFLAVIKYGDVGRCGRSGRWICGSTDGGKGPLRLADIRSGDGWEVLKTHSILCYPGTGDASSPYDIDSKGSPDGTKIAFISTYDLKEGPSTEITEDGTENRIVVMSTKGFPERGRLVAVTGSHREVLGYERKTPASFEGLKRGLYDTPTANLRIGLTLTSFEARLIPEDIWKDLPLQASQIRNVIKDMDSPLMRQKMSDIYVAVVRSPDKPYIQKGADYAELVPGENHWETHGYHIFRDGTKITSSPILPGASFTLPGGGTYTAAAVEWSELQSKKSLPLKIQSRMTLKVLNDKPSDFSWTYNRWLIDGKEVSEGEGKKSEKAVREIVHLYDGVIHREWYNWGQIVRRYDLNLDGKPIRRLFYQNGKIFRREYHDSYGIHVSTELFDPDGYITETIQYHTVNGKSAELSHWWYERGVHVKNARSSTTGSEIYIKDGNRWLKY